MVSSSTTYMSTTYGSYEGCYSFTYGSPSTGYTAKSNYIADYQGTPTGYDIGYQPVNGGGDIWMATDEPTSPVKCYEATSGGVCAAIPASIGIGSDIRGVTFDTNNHLWVSNPTTDKLYEISDYVGISSPSVESMQPQSLSVGCNPFNSTLVISINGFGENSVLEIYDLQGRLIHSVAVANSYTWDAANIPSGTYILRVTGDSGPVISRNIVKL